MCFEMLYKYEFRILLRLEVYISAFSILVRDFYSLGLHFRIDSDRES